MFDPVLINEGHTLKIHSVRSISDFTKSLYWSSWLFWRSSTNRWLLAVLAMLTGIAVLGGYTAFSKRQAIIAQGDELEAFNRKIQKSEFSNDTDLEKIVGRPLTEEELGKAKTQRMIATLPTSLAYSGGNFNAVLPPSSWMILGLGFSDLSPDRYRITAHSRRENLAREDIASPYQLAYGMWDATTIVLVVMSLVIIALTYDVVSAERERGLLPLLFVNVVSYRQWVFCNALIRTLFPVMTVLAISLPLAISIALTEGLPDIATPVILWTTVVIGYGLFWMSVAMLVNSGRGSTLQNGVILMTVWLCVVCIIPALISRLAILVQPVLTMSEIITRERELRETAEQNGSKLLEDYYLQHPEVSRPSREEDPYGQTRWDAIRLDVDGALQPSIDKQSEQLRMRLTISEWGMFVSPALAAKIALDDICGTSLRHHIEFNRRSSEFDEEFKMFFQPRMMSREQLTLSDYEAMPQYQQRSLSFTRHNLLLTFSLTSISAWFGLVFSVSWYRLRHVFIAN